MGHASHSNYPTKTAPFVPYTDVGVPSSYVGEAIYSVLETMVRLVGRGFKALRTRMREAATARAVAELDDHLLKDIGIHRSEIRYLARMATENPGFDHRVMRR